MGKLVHGRRALVVGEVPQVSWRRGICVLPMLCPPEGGVASLWGWCLGVGPGDL